MRRRLKYSVLIVVALILLLCVLVVTTNWGLSLLLSVVATLIPGHLAVAQTTGDLLGPIQFDGVEYRSDALQVTVRHAELDWHLAGLISGELVIETLHVDELTVVQSEKPATASAQTKTASDLFLFPVDITVHESSFNHVRYSGPSLANPVDIDNISFSVQAVHDTLKLERLLISAYQASLITTGTVKLNNALPVNLATDIQYAVNPNAVLRSAGNITGDLRHLEVHQKITGIATGQLDATGTNLATEMQWNSSLELANLNLARLNKELPPLELSGSLKSKGDTKRLTVKGDVNVEDKAVGQGSLHFDGSADLVKTQYQFDMLGDFVGIDLPPGNMQFHGQGDQKTLSLSDVHITMLNGEVNGQARVQWLPVLDIDAELLARSINLAGLSGQWPSRLNAKLVLKTDTKTTTPQYQLALSDLSGVLRGHPLQGHGQASSDLTSASIDDLHISVDKSYIDISGAIRDDWSLKIHSASNDLGHILPDAKGQFELTGNITGKRSEPVFSLTAKASDIQYRQEGVDALSIKALAGLPADAALDINIRASGIQSRYGHWRELDMVSSGTNKSHSLNASLQNDASHVETGLEGRFLPWQWRGRMTTLNAKPQYTSEWKLRQAVDITLSPAEISFSTLCLAQDSAHICAGMQWGQDKRTLELNGESVPLQLAKRWIPQNMELTGQVDIDGRLHADRGDAFTGGMEITAAYKAINVHFPDINETVTLAKSNMRVSFEPGALQAAVNLPLIDGGGIESQLTLKNWSWQTMFVRNQPVNARLNIDNIPADTITRFIPDMARAEGNLQADLTVSGILGEPQIRGTARWRDGNMIIPDLGISITNIQAELQSRQSNKLQFRIQANSGEGSVVLNGETTLDPAQGWPTQIDMKSERLEVVNIPEAYILIDSKINVTMQGSTINIDGDINVPRARLRPRSLPAGSEQLSRDAIILDEDEKSAATKWRVTSRVRVNLGDLVDFDGFGVSGKLKGSLLLIDEPGKLALGRGEVSIEDGIYRLRGQDLTIRRGRLIFADTFIDDPGIDVDAIREVETVIVGVRLKGTLRQPQLTLFSEPTMSESDILTYLIFGHSAATSTTTETESMRNNAAAMGFVAGDILSQEIGGRLGLDEMRVDVGGTAENTALVMGKYLSSKLYVRYFSGLIESSSIVQLRYQLSDRVQIQTEGGYRGSQSITGGDIFFTIEY